MNGTRPRFLSLKTSSRLVVMALVAAVLAYSAAVSLSPSVDAQAVAVDPGTSSIRIGERLTYSISIGRFTNAAYAELYAVSRGRLGDREAIELRAKFKTLD